MDDTPLEMARRPAIRCRRSVIRKEECNRKERSGAELQDLPPEAGGTRGQVRKVFLDLLDERGPLRAQQELLDVPGVLGASRVELEQDQIGPAEDRHLHPHEDRRLSSLDRSPLPQMLADDDVEGELGGELEPHDSRQRIVRISFAHFDADSFRGESVPGPGIEAGPVDREEIDVDGRAVDAMDRQGRGADQDVRNSSSLQDPAHPREQAHPMISSMHLEGWRPAWRRRWRRRMAVWRSTPWAWRKASSPISPISKTRRTRSSRGSLAKASRSSRRRSSATECMEESIGACAPENPKQGHKGLQGRQGHQGEERNRRFPVLAVLYVLESLSSPTYLPLSP